MRDKPDFFYLKTKKKLGDLKKHRPTAEQIIHQKLTRTTTEYDLRVISPDVFFTEEQRGNVHIIGSSRQGKSRFMEWLMREDIGRGIGCCLLDPTAGGETAYRMLAYCAEKGVKKVLFIDPAHADHPYRKVAGLQPFKYDKDGRGWPKLKRISVGTLMNAVRSLYSVKDPAEQSRVERYLPAVFSALYDAQSPLTGARYLANRLYKAQREAILSLAAGDVRTDLKEAYTPAAYLQFQSTVNRLVRFLRGTLGFMFSADRGVDWMKVVREHWVVIVNLDSLDFFDARLLGTYIIAELETAKQRLNQLMDEKQDADRRGKYPPFYLYADEAFMFASQSLKNMLDLKQKMNFKVTLAHHYAKQFDDPAVYNSILQNCDITAMFYTRSHADRKQIATEFYGGDIGFEDAAFATKGLQKQHAVIKIGKDNPVFTRIPDVPPSKVKRAELHRYVCSLYESQPWYYGSKELRDKLERTVYAEPVQSGPRKGTRVSKRNPPPHDKADHQTVKGKSAFSRAEPTGRK
jgi:hypothetical protein